MLVLEDLERVDLRLVQLRPGLGQETVEVPFRLFEGAAEVLALGRFEMECERQLVLGAPVVLVQQRETGAEVTQRHLKSSRRLGLAPRGQVQTRQREPLGLAGDQAAAEVQVLRDIEETLPGGGGIPALPEEAAHSQVGELLSVLWYERVGSLLDPVVKAPVGGRFRRRRQDEPFIARFLEVPGHSLDGLLADDGDRARIERTADAGGKAEGALAGRWGGPGGAGAEWGPRRFESGQRAHQQMARVDFVVPVGADQEKEFHPRAGEERAEKAQRRRVGPLQVVDEDHQRMLALRQRAHEVLEDELEPVLRLGGGERRRRRLLAQDELDLRNEFRQDTRVGAERFREPRAPSAQAGLALGEQLLQEAAEGLDQRAVGNIADDRIELAGDEVTPLADDGLVELLDERRLADARVAPHHHHLGGACAGAVEGPQQLVDLAAAAIQLPWDEEPVRDVALADRELVDPALRGPLPLAGFEIRFQTESALVPFLGRLRQELHHHSRELLRHAGVNAGRRGWRLGDVRVDQLERVIRSEGRRSRQQLVEDDTERVEVGPVVDRAVHPAGLLRRDVGERAPEQALGQGRDALSGDLRREAEVAEPQLAGVRMDQDTPWIDVLVDEVGAMELRQRRRELDGDLQRELEVQCARGEQRLQRDFASVLENQAGSPILPFQGVDADDPGKSEVARERRLALEQLRVEGTRGMPRS